MEPFTFGFRPVLFLPSCIISNKDILLSLASFFVKLYHPQRVVSRLTWTILPYLGRNSRHSTDISSISHSLSPKAFPKPSLYLTTPQTQVFLLLPFQHLCFCLYSYLITCFILFLVVYLPLLHLMSVTWKQSLHLCSNRPQI